MNLKKLTVEILMEKGPLPEAPEDVIKKYPYYDADQEDLHMYSREYIKVRGWEIPMKVVEVDFQEVVRLINLEEVSFRKILNEKLINAGFDMKKQIIVFEDPVTRGVTYKQEEF